MKSAHRSRRLARKEARARRRKRESTRPPPGEPCTCGGRFSLRGDPILLFHTEPLCDGARAVDSDRTAEVYIQLQRRAALAREAPIYTVPWFPEMVCEMPGFVMHAVRELVLVTTTIGMRRVDVYADELRLRMPDIPEDSIVRVMVIAEILGIISRVEVPEGTTRGHASADVN